MYWTIIIYNAAKVYIRSWHRRTEEYIQPVLKITYGGYYITEEEKKSTMDIVDEQINIEFNAQ